MISNSRIDLDNESYIGCAFDDCEIVFRGKGTYELKNCTFNRCNFRLEGPALQTLKYLTDMYRVGPEVFGVVLDNIRNGIMPR